MFFVERERLQQIRTVSDLDVALDKLAILRAFSFALLSACQDLTSKSASSFNLWSRDATSMLAIAATHNNQEVSTLLSQNRGRSIVHRGAIDRYFALREYAH